MSPIARILLFAGLGLAVVLAGLWISGGKKENYSASISIQAHPKQVFRYLTDPEKLKTWMVGLESVDEPIPPKTGEGTEFDVPPDLVRTFVTPSGKHVRFNDKVIRYTEDQFLTVQSSNASTTRTAIFQLEPIGRTGTQVSYEIRVAHSGLGRLMSPLQSSSLQDQINTEIRNLKEQVEKNEPEYQWPDETETEGADPDEKANERSSDDPVDVSGED